MGVHVKSLAARGGLALIGMAVSALFLKPGLLDAFGDRIGFDQSRADAQCSGGTELSAATFYGEMRRVNALMHASMEIAPSGSTDRDFAQMMIAHHQGAIDMALVQLKFGGDERLRRLAQSIIVEQGQEIAYMRGLLGNKQASPSNHLAGQ